MNSKKIIKIIIAILMIAVLFYCGYQLFLIYQDYHTSDSEYSNLSEQFTNIVIDDEEDDEEIRNTSIITNKKKEKAVNWEELTAINSQIIGWIYSPDTSIDYPILQDPESNDTYIHKTCEGKYASAGSIFLDFRNSDKLINVNNIIYGHNMKNGSMFRDIRKYKDQEYYEAHKYIYIFLKDGTKHKYEVISAYQTLANDECYRVDFTPDELEIWLKKIHKQSRIKCRDYELDKPVITLSTCCGRTAGGLERWVVHLQELEE